ncbi:MAG: hypothetical protein HKM24_01685, partial [Gammaproteobacteria bacterium]|nr:hypothetical protein [Gammaproteobacteria bacterium]
AHWGVAWIYLGVILGLAVYWKNGDRIRNVALQHNAFTFFHLLKSYFGRRTARYFAMLAFSGYLVLTVLQLAIGAKLLTLTGVFSLPIATLILIGFSIVYLIAGGLKASVISDTIQLTLITAFIAVSFWFAVKSAPVNPETVISMFSTDGLSINIATTFLFLSVLMFTPDALLRIFATDKSNSVRHAVNFSITLFMVFGALLGAIGIWINANYPTIAAEDAPLMLITQIIPAGFQAFAILGLLATIMSSIDTNLFTAAQTLANDIVQSSLFESKRSARRAIRWALIILLPICSIMALTIDNVVEIYFYLVFFLACGCHPLIAIMCNKRSAFAVVSSSAFAVTSCVVLLVVGKLTEINAAAIIATSIVYWWLSASWLERKLPITTTKSSEDVYGRNVSDVNRDDFEGAKLAS